MEIHLKKRNQSSQTDHFICFLKKKIQKRKKLSLSKKNNLKSRISKIKSKNKTNELILDRLLKNKLEKRKKKFCNKWLRKPFKGEKLFILKNKEINFNFENEFEKVKNYFEKNSKKELKIFGQLNYSFRNILDYQDFFFDIFNGFINFQKKFDFDKTKIKSKPIGENLEISYSKQDTFSKNIENEKLPKFKQQPKIYFPEKSINSEKEFLYSTIEISQNIQKDQITDTFKNLNYLKFEEGPKFTQNLKNFQIKTEFSIIDGFTIFIIWLSNYLKSEYISFFIETISILLIDIYNSENFENFSKFFFEKFLKLEKKILEKLSKKYERLFFNVFGFNKPMYMSLIDVYEIFFEFVIGNKILTF